jgi:uncharacterized membrane protein
MGTVLTILHVVGAVFIVGPMAMLPMSAMRAIRTRHANQVSSLAKSTLIFSVLSLVVVIFGFGAMSLADPKYHLTVATPWIWISIVLYLIALLLSIFLVVPTMRRASKDLEDVGDASTSGTATRSYPAISAGSGVATLLLLAVVVLMVWKP